jgi:hypothetical protein
MDLWIINKEAASAKKGLLENITKLNQKWVFILELGIRFDDTGTLSLIVLLYCSPIITLETSRL